jgi:hypothetical protein
MKYKKYFRIFMRLLKNFERLVNLLIQNIFYVKKIKHSGISSIIFVANGLYDP